MISSHAILSIRLEENWSEEYLARQERGEKLKTHFSQVKVALNDFFVNQSHFSSSHSTVPPRPC
jgi:hypothetical protein